ncbi:MAG: hypothetical protein JRK53_12605 [Deltaproteobacteria bacterium]|nr:hypothetical protein [Deltaproteobacteria bacterium]MBW1819296.1 hypothetical protein [Deltaproteobacteria bacterium]
MDKKTRVPRLSGIVFVVLFCFFQGCAARHTIPQISNALPPNELAYYSDSFDELRNDLWDRTGLLFRQEQLKNFRSADMRIEHGQLVIRSHVGSFSKGGLGSNFMLRGDYDVQIDCQFNFIKEPVDMDQILSFVALEQGPDGHETRGWVSMTLIKVPGKENRILFNYRDFRDWERILKIGWHSTGDFNGTFRIVRAGKRVFISYRRGDGPWRQADVFPSIGGDTHFGMVCQNFILQRKSIHATQPVIGRFDNFKINAAQGILEEDI